MSEQKADDIEQQRIRIALLHEEIKCAKELLRIKQMPGMSHVLSIRVSGKLFQEIVKRANTEQNMSSLIRAALEQAFPSTD